MKNLTLEEKRQNAFQQNWAAKAKSLKLWEIRLIELRNFGMGYIEISEALQKEFKNIIGKGKIKSFHISTLRNMLSSEGKLYDAYGTYGEMIAIESFEEGQRSIQNAHSIAASTMVALMSKKQTGATRLGAAKDILDRNAGKAIQKVEMQENHSEVEEMRKKLKGIFN